MVTVDDVKALLDKDVRELRDVAAAALDGLDPAAVARVRAGSTDPADLRDALATVRGGLGLTFLAAALALEADVLVGPADGAGPGGLGAALDATADALALIVRVGETARDCLRPVAG